MPDDRAAAWARRLRRFFAEETPFLLLLLLAAVGYLLAFDALGGHLLDHAIHDSYTLQSAAWLDGKTYLRDGANLTYLELAVFEGKYYVSFPPVPSVAMLPLVLKYGKETPNTLLVAVYGLLSLVFAYRACCAAGQERGAARFWAAFAVFGCNLMQQTTQGGVWMQAQALNFLLCMIGVDAALRDRRTLCFLALALAVGCRPFSILYLPVSLVWFLYRDRAKEQPVALSASVRRLILPVLVAAAVGGVYMWYNAVRFGNPLEFGHNYLPEFTREVNGQFHWSYLGGNLYNLFLRGFSVLPTGEIEYPEFNGFLFYVTNPLFLAWAVQFFRDARKRRLTAPGLACAAAFVLNILFLCLHRTLGGWQFGARYTIDLIPFVLFALLITGKNRPNTFERFLAGFGILVNVYGTVELRLSWSGY